MQKWVADESWVWETGSFLKDEMFYCKAPSPQVCKIEGGIRL